MKDESQQQVPPGIEAFINKYKIVHRLDTGRYEQWASDFINDPDSTVHTISEDGIEWSIGDEADGEGIIIQFNWDNVWYAIFESGMVALSSLSKLPSSSLDRSVERVWDEEMNRWVERPNKTIEEKLDRSGSQPGEGKESEEVRDTKELNKLISEGKELNIVKLHAELTALRSEIQGRDTRIKELEACIKTVLQCGKRQPCIVCDGEMTRALNLTK